jgi:large subunit ribosomal protein L25
MAEVQLAADARRTTGSSESRRLRAVGKVPAVLYGHGITPQALAVDARALRGALNQATGLNALLLLQVETTQHLAMARQLQRHPVRGSVEHVDFVIVRRDEVVEVEVPVRLVGEASSVEKASGVVEQQVFMLVVQAKPGDLPPAIEIDVTELKVGDTVRVGDLKLPPGVATEVDPEETIVVATSSTIAAEIEAEEEEAAEAAEGEAGEGAGEADASEGGGGEAGSPEG